MARRGRRVAAIAACAVVLGVAGCTSSEPEPAPPTVRPQGQPTPPRIREGGTLRPDRLIVGYTPYLRKDALRSEVDALARYLGEAVGLPAVVRESASYADLARKILQHEVHVGVLSPLSYVRAKREEAGLVLLATPIADGSPSYPAYIVVRSDSPFQTVEDLRGKRFGYVDELSSSGYLYALAHLRRLGHDPQTFFAHTVFAGDHTRLVEKILSGEVDGGATFSTVFDTAEGRKLRIIAKTGRVPLDAYCATPRLAQELIDQLRGALLALSTRTSEGQRVLEASKVNGFVIAADDFYDSVREVDRLVQEQRTAPDRAHAEPAAR